MGGEGGESNSHLKLSIDQGRWPFDIFDMFVDMFVVHDCLHMSADVARHFRLARGHVHVDICPSLCQFDMFVFDMFMAHVHGT